MTTDQTRRLSRLVGLFAVAGGTVFGLAMGGAVPSAAVAAQEKEKEKDPDKPSTLPTLMGIGQCVLCHSTQKGATYPPGVALFVKAGSTKFIRLDENLIWSENDLHSRSFQNLTGPLGKAMEREMKRAEPGFKATEDVRCLACHATATGPLVKGQQLTVKHFDSSQGVTCEMCHGHASNWYNPHSKLLANRIDWREWPPGKKTNYNLIDLRDPKVRAAKCAECHIGNLDQGKFVTHDMFAAGHPPLPPLDVIAYFRDQPRHWGFPREMPYLVDLAKSPKTAKTAWDVFHYRSEEDVTVDGKTIRGEVYAARQLAISTLATFRSSIQLIGQVPGASDGGLDFAAFDCYACHHDLVFPSPRQKRGYVGKPGRPSFRPWLSGMTRLMVRHGIGTDRADAKDGLVTRLSALERELAVAFDQKTFGEPEAIRKVCAKIDVWCQEALEVLEGIHYDRDQALRLLKDVIAAGRDEKELIADPESAQLIAWAFLTLREELRVSPPKQDEPAVITGLCGRLDTLVVTRLRADPKAKKKANVPDPLGGENNETPVPIEDRLGERLKLFNRFDVTKFRQTFDELNTQSGLFK